MSTDDAFVPPGEPTPAEIREACRKIREGWSDREHRTRAGLQTEESWLPPGLTRVIPATGCQNQELADK